MKTTVITAGTIILVWLGCVDATPHSAHRSLHAKKDYTTEIITEYYTVTVPEVIVWVDGNGKIVSTETDHSGLTSATSTIGPVSSTSIAESSSTSSAVTCSSVSASAVVVAHVSNTPVSTSVATTAPPPSPEPVSTTTLEPATVASTASSTAVGNLATATDQSTSARVDPENGATHTQGSLDGHIPAGGSFHLGIAYDILKGGAPGICKTESDVSSDIALFNKEGYDLVRLYGIDCNQVSLVAKYASRYDMRIFVTLGSLSDLEDNLKSIITSAGSNLGVIDTVAIGNELVNSGTAPSAVVAALNTAKAILENLGFTGYLVTVDTVPALSSNPSLCAASDYIAVNCHGYFTDTITADGDGAYVQSQVAALQQANGGKRVVVTESGWPYGGRSNGAAVPSPQNQQTAIAGLKSAFSQDLILFEAFDSQYKVPGPDGVEQYFGVYGH